MCSMLFRSILSHQLCSHDIPILLPKLWGTPLQVRNDHDTLGMVRLYYIPMISPTYPYKVHDLIPIIHIYIYTYV